MKNTKFNLHTKIINLLGRCGPMTRQELIEATGSSSITTRIYEINKTYRSLRIEKHPHTDRYYFKITRNIRIDPKKVYVDYYARKAS